LNSFGFGILFISVFSYYLLSILSKDSRGCTEGQACNRTPYTHTYNTKKKKKLHENNTKIENDGGLHGMTF